eukprot:g76602.t1
MAKRFLSKKLMMEGIETSCLSSVRAFFVCLDMPSTISMLRDHHVRTSCLSQQSQACTCMRKYLFSQCSYMMHDVMMMEYFEVGAVDSVLALHELTCQPLHNVIHERRRPLDYLSSLDCPCPHIVKYTTFFPGSQESDEFSYVEVVHHRTAHITLEEVLGCPLSSNAFEFSAGRKVTVAQSPRIFRTPTPSHGDPSGPAQTFGSDLSLRKFSVLPVSMQRGLANNSQSEGLDAEDQSKEQPALEPSQVVTLDVGGTIFRSRVETLTQHSSLFKELLQGGNVQHKSGDALFLDLDPDAFAFILSYFRDKSKSALLDIIHHYYLAQYASFHETHSSGYGDVYPQNLTFCRACVIPLNYDKEFTNVYMERKVHSGDKYKYSDGEIWGYPLLCVSCDASVGYIKAGNGPTYYGDGSWESDGSTMRPGAVMTFPVLRDFRKTLTTAQKRVASSGVHQLRYLQGQQYPLCHSGISSTYGEPRDNETRAMMWFTKIR